MKIAISNIAWDRSEDDAVAKLMQSLVVKGLDIAPGKLSDNPVAMSEDEVRTYVDFWAMHDVQIVGMQSMLYGHPELRIFDDEETRQQTIDYLKQIILLAEAAGVGPMVFGSPKNRQIGDLPLNQAIDIALDFFGELATFAHQHHTVLCLEPNPPHYNCDFINTANQAIDFVERIDHPGFRLHLDSAIMSMNNEPIETTLENALPCLAHFHISEPQLGLVTAASEVEHQRFATCLRRFDYQQWVSIEMRGGWSTTDAESVEQALGFVTQIYG